MRIPSVSRFARFEALCSFHSLLCLHFAGELLLENQPPIIYHLALLRFAPLPAATVRRGSEQMKPNALTYNVQERIADTWPCNCNRNNICNRWLFQCYCSDDALLLFCFAIALALVFPSYVICMILIRFWLKNSAKNWTLYWFLYLDLEIGKWRYVCLDISVRTESSDESYEIWRASLESERTLAPESSQYEPSKRSNLTMIFIQMTKEENAISIDSDLWERKSELKRVSRCHHKQSTHIFLELASPLAFTYACACVCSVEPREQYV